ncbi:MAG: hypothetical protein JOZ54_00845 [Acidobacteria bacterium]|nr:hypothetical protein [Acidobacteriota bacterium]
MPRLIALALLLSLTFAARADDIALLSSDTILCIGAPQPLPPLMVRWAGRPVSAGIVFQPSIFWGSIGEGPDGELLAARDGANRGVSRFEKDGSFTRLFDLPSGFTPSEVLSRRDGEILVFGNGRIFRRAPNGAVTVDVMNGGDAYDADLDETGCMLAQVGLTGIERYDLCTAGSHWQTWHALPNVRHVRYAPNGRLLVATYERIQLLDRATGTVLRDFPSPTQPFLVELSPSGRRVWVAPASSGCGGSFDNTLREYDLETGALVSELAYTTGPPIRSDLANSMAVRDGWRAALSENGAPGEEPLPGRRRALR